MFLINSAKFKVAEFELSHQAFFVGSNVGGKTTSTRALHYLYNANVNKLGIPNDKKKFSLYYFPYENSYIIYCFKDFFILNYKTGDVIKRYFSKQPFDKSRVLKDGNETFNFNEIIKYVKEVSYYHPKTIDEYLGIIYGQNRKYIDFSIAKIKNHKVFIELLNTVFNVDKAIVDITSIKRTIQMALNREDEILEIDYDGYIKKLNDFIRDWNFFYTFDNQSKNINKALAYREELVTIETINEMLFRKMAHRLNVEKEYLGKFTDELSAIGASINRLEKQEKGRRKIKDKKLPKLQNRINKLDVDIKLIHKAKEEYNQDNFEYNSEIANKYNTIKVEVEQIVVRLNSLKTQMVSVVESLDKKIKELEHKIEVLIPNEYDANVLSASRSLKLQLDDEADAINEEYSQLMEPINITIKKNIFLVDKTNENIAIKKRELIDKKQEILQQLETSQDEINTQKKKHNSNISLEEDKIESYSKSKRVLNRKLDELTEKHKDERKEIAINLLKVKNTTSQKIDALNAALKPLKGSFGEYLVQNVVNWEKELYPILDDSLLLKNVSLLNPKLDDNGKLLGIDIDTSHLKNKLTKAETLEKIKELRIDKFQQLQVAKDISITKRSDYEIEKASLEAQIQEQQNRIDKCVEQIDEYNKAIFQSNTDIKMLKDNASIESNKIDNGYRVIIEELNFKLEDYRKIIATKNKQINELVIQQRKDLKKSNEDYEYNLNAMKKLETKKMEAAIDEVNKEIKQIKKEKKNKDEDNLISELEIENKDKNKELEECLKAKEWLKKFIENKDEIDKLPTYRKARKETNDYLIELITSLDKSFDDIKKLKEKHKDKRTRIINTQRIYSIGIEELGKLDIPFDKYAPLDVNEYLRDIVEKYKDNNKRYKNRKTDLKELIGRFKSLEEFPLVEVNLNMNKFYEVESILDLENIMNGLDELNDFSVNKYDTQKKNSHRNFEQFFRNTLRQKLSNFGNLENEFLTEVSKINSNLSKADFGVVKDIKIVSRTNEDNRNSIGALFERLEDRIKNSVSLYNKDSLFQDNDRAVRTIEDIIEILNEIKKKGSGDKINLFDAIDLSFSYTESGEKIENKLQLNNESSSGGDIMIKVPLAISILSSYYKEEVDKSPFYLIIDEVSRLERANQTLLRNYVNSYGFKTLFITPNSMYPDPDRAIYYTFKNSQNGTGLAVTQMNILN